VFLSQVIHHLPSLEDALREIARVSAQGAMLAVRQSTRESNSAVQWTAFFPEAAAIDRERVPARDELVATIERSGFETAARLTVRQLFATSYDDYVAKIAQRGLSPLIAISDDAFESGLQRLRIWAAAQPRGVPVFEPIDYLLFRNSTVGLAVRQPVE